MTCISTYCYGIMNPELEKRKELERRKKLRLIQVRQQSKEFADNLRERIKGELTQQKKKYLESENKLKQEKHLQELCHLKELYDRCLQSIGKGHRDATEQPDLNVEKQNQLTKISARASVRGAKAIKKQLEDEASLKQKTEAPVKKKKAIRNKENLRAFFISSLPKHVEQHGPISFSPPKPVHRSAEPQKTSGVLQEIPSNLTGCESRVPGLQSAVKPNILRKESKVGGGGHCRKQNLSEIVIPATKVEDYNVANECHCNCIVCACHESPRPLRLRRCSSESRLSSDKGLDFEEPRKRKVRSRSCSPRSVRTLNYFDCGNVYESNQQSFVRVTHHSRSSRETEGEPAQNTVQEVPIAKLSADELKKRTEERSAKALRKEQLKRDFQKLIQNLKKITQEKSLIKNKTKAKFKVFSSERDILTRNENKQRKLNDAFEKLPRSLTSVKTQSTGVQKPNQVSCDDSSPSTLNLALYQANMPSTSPSQLVTRVVSTEEFIISETSIPASSGYGKRSKSKSPKPTQSSNMAHSGCPNSPMVVVNTDSKGDVHISVKVSEVLGSKQKRPTQPQSKSPTPTRSRSPTPTKSSSPTAPSSGSSYMGLPVNLTPSQQKLVDALLHQANKHALGGELKNYINKLLKMSRDGIDALFGTSKVPRPTSSSPTGGDIERDLMKLGELAELYAEKVNRLVEMYECMGSPPTRDTDEWEPPLEPVRAVARNDPNQCPTFDPVRPVLRTTPTSSCCPTPTAMSTPSPAPRPVRTPPVPAACPPPDPCMRPTPSPSSSGQQSLASTADTDELIFGGFDGRMPPPPTKTAADRGCCNPRLWDPPPGFDLEEFMRQKQHLIQQDYRESDIPYSGDDTGFIPYGDEDFGARADVTPETCWEDQMDFPDFDLHEPIGEKGIILDTCTAFDTSALQGPLDMERLNAVRQRLANICNEKYREILEMLQRDATEDQLQFENILKQATSDPFLDPNLT